MVGSIAGIALIIGAFFLGRRRAHRSHATVVRGEDPNSSTSLAELSGEKPSTGVWARIQGALGPAKHDGSSGPGELAGRRDVPELDGMKEMQLQELPGHQPQVSELAAYPEALKDVETSGADTPKVDPSRVANE